MGISEQVRTSSFAVVANGFADGPAQALRDHLAAKGARVLFVAHPLEPEEGRGHLVAAYEGGRLVEQRVVRLPVRPPFSYLADPFVPLRTAPAEVWFGFNPLSCARGLVARRAGRVDRVVLWSVDFVPDRFGTGTVRTRAYDWLDRHCCRHADARIELTEAARAARAHRHGLDPDGPPVHIVPMGVWLARTPTADDDAFQRRRLVLLAHLVRRQGADVLLEALALLRADASGPVSAEIVGAGPREADLRTQAKSLGIGDLVHFHGFVPDHRRVERIVADASIAVAPYRPGEGTFTHFADPGKLKVYLAAGLPIVLTNVPPNASELAEKAGAEIVAFDPMAIADAVTRLLTDHREWRARHEAALAYVEQFNWPVLLDDVLGRLGVADFR